MSESETFPLSGSEVLVEAMLTRTFLFALSRGLPEWDAQWEEVNPPTPPRSSTGVQDLIGYARPTIVDCLSIDGAGAIVADSGTRYSVSNAPVTPYLRTRLALPVGTYAGQRVREIALFVGPTIAEAVPAGQTIIDPEDVVDPGKLFQIKWMPAQPLSAGSFFARNLVLRL